MAKPAWMKKLAPLFGLSIILLTLFLWQLFFPDQYFLAAVLLLVESILLWLLILEQKQLEAREIALTAALSTLGIAGRALFFFVPQVKPTAAIVIISGLSLGSGPGFTIGLLTMFLSNFLFGQSINTPFQMVGMGLLGFLAGFFAKRKKPLPLPLISLIGFFLTFVVYGIAVDTGSVLFLYNWQGEAAIWSVYLAGVPFNLVHAGSTAVFLFFLSPLLTRQLQRISRKYGLFSGGVVK